MTMIQHDDAVRLESEAGDLIGEARPADGTAIPDPPLVPTFAAAIAAGLGFPGLHGPFHPICFCCGDEVEEGVGLRVFVGQLAGAGAGVVAGPWTPNPVFADADGLAPDEVIWAALDCPGVVSWVVTGGGHALLGTMTAQLIRRPAVGETCIVLAWPIERSGRKLISGTALFTSDGELLAKSHQVWIGRDAGRRSGLTRQLTESLFSGCETK